MVIFLITWSGRVQKSQIKKNKKNFHMGRFPLRFFLFPVIKRAEKVSGFVLFRKGRGKCEIDYIKKRKFFFSFRELFNDYWWLVCRKR